MPDHAGFKNTSISMLMIGSCRPTSPVHCSTGRRTRNKKFTGADDALSDMHDMVRNHMLGVSLMQRNAI